MRLWDTVRGLVRGSSPEALPEGEGDGANHLDLARRSLRELIDDPRVPEEVRSTLAEEYRQVEELLTRLEQGHIHVAVFGRVSVGKSALLNALVGEERFAVSPLHGETREPRLSHWREVEAGGLFLIDTPGINEVAGEERERMAVEVAGRSDLVLFVVDGDLTDSEYQAIVALQRQHRPLLLVLNKADRYTAEEERELLDVLTRRTEGLVRPEHVIPCSARPAERVYVLVDGEGRERETRRRPLPDVVRLRERLWEILEVEGKTLAALNASLFAGDLADRVAERLTRVKADLAERLMHTYCLGKGVAVAFNPVPVVDVLSVVADAALVIHLGKLYGLPVTRAEAGGLLRTIVGQMALLMGTVWGVHLASSVLKGVSMGLSVLFTAGTQGAVAYYGTYVVGRAAERYFAQGKSWGPGGPKRVVEEILATLDRRSILAQARAEILSRIKGRRG